MKFRTALRNSTLRSVHCGLNPRCPSSVRRAVALRPSVTTFLLLSTSSLAMSSISGGPAGGPVLGGLRGPFGASGAAPSPPSCCGASGSGSWSERADRSSLKPSMSYSVALWNRKEDADDY